MSRFVAIDDIIARGGCQVDTGVKGVKAAEDERGADIFREQATRRGEGDLEGHAPSMRSSPAPVNEEITRPGRGSSDG